MNTSYKFDVAFSFLTRDEGVAVQLNDLLADRVRTFIYTERQKELAGTDGEETFGRVFREESRLVVVLYRAGWGETKWTRVEQTAIRARAFDLGYNFVKFIPLDEPATVPPWLPPTQLYIGLQIFGVAGVAAVIEQRIRELGGEIHQETIEEQAQRLQRQIGFERRQTAFRREPGVQAVQNEIRTLKQEIQARAVIVKEAASIALHTGETRQGFWLIGLGRALTPSWRQKVFNTLEDARLEVSLFSFMPSDRDWVFENPAIVKILRFEFDLLQTDVPGWISTEGRRRTFSTAELAEHLVRFYLENGRSN